jgi:hypothetical protein
MTKTNTPKSPTPLIKLIPLSFIVLTGILGISLLISAHISWVLAIIFSITLGLAVIVVSFLYRELSMSWTALCAVLAAILCGMYLSSYYDVKDREIIRDVSLAEAMKYPDAGGWIFTEGAVRSDLSATYAYRATHTDGTPTVSYYYAAPIITKNWNRGLPVTVWAVRQRYDKEEFWDQPLKAGVRVDPHSRDHFRTAVGIAAQKHGLTSHENFIMVKWVPSPEKAVATYLEDFKSTAIIWYIVWLVGLLAGRIFIGFRRRKQKATGTDPEPSTTDSPAKTAKPITTANLLRFLFVVYCFLALEFSLFVSGLDFSSAINIILLTVAIVFFIIASTSLLKAHKSEGRPLTDLLWIMLYPFPAYAAVFFTIDIGSNLFWAFPGYFYFLAITGGFVLGIVFSPFLAKRKATEREKDDIARAVRDGIGKTKSSGALRSIAILLTGAFVAVAYFFTRFLAGLAELTIVQKGIFCFLLLLAVAGVVKFTVRHTRFGRPAKGRD